MNTPQNNSFSPVMNSPANNPQPKIWNKTFIITLCAATLLAIAVIVTAVILIVSNSSKKPQQNFDTTDASVAEIIPVPITTQPLLAITNCPEQITTDSPSFTAEGYIVSDISSCTLTINGESVATTGAPGNQVKWSKYIQLSAGETKELTFEVRDNNNNVTTEKRYVYCQQLNEVKKAPTGKPAPITPGCSLVKKKPGGLNIRWLPGTEYSVIDYIGAHDYTSEMIFTGNYTVGSEGYTWYEVISPSGKHGYVRSDLVRSNTYIN